MSPRGGKGGLAPFHNRHALGFSKDRNWPSLLRFSPNMIERLEQWHASTATTVEGGLYRPNAFLERPYRAAIPSPRLTVWDPFWVVLIVVVCTPFVLAASVSQSNYRPLSHGLVALLAAAYAHNGLIFLFGPGFVPRYFMLTQVAAVMVVIGLLAMAVSALVRSGPPWYPARLGGALHAAFPLARLARPTAVRYAIVGVAIAALYWLLANIGMYLLPGLSAWLVSNTALLIAIGAQYVGHALFTFGTGMTDRSQAVKFIATIAVGLTVSTLVTGWVAPVLEISQFWATAFVMIAVPVFNYIVLNAWVFSKGPESQATALDLEPKQP